MLIRYANVLSNICKDRNINVELNSNLIEIKPESKEAVFQQGGSTKTINYDFIHVTPPMSAPDFIKKVAVHLIWLLCFFVVFFFYKGFYFFLPRSYSPIAASNIVTTMIYLCKTWLMICVYCCPSHIFKLPCFVFVFLWGLSFFKTIELVVFVPENSCKTFVECLIQFGRICWCRSVHVAARTVP